MADEEPLRRLRQVEADDGYGETRPQNKTKKLNCLNERRQTRFFCFQKKKL